jgi:hypothetical protein
LQSGTEKGAGGAQHGVFQTDEGDAARTVNDRGSIAMDGGGAMHDIRNRAALIGFNRHAALSESELALPFLGPP